MTLSGGEVWRVLGPQKWLMVKWWQRGQEDILHVEWLAYHWR